MHYRKILNEFTEPVIRKLIAKFSEVDEQTIRFYLDEFEKYKTELDKKDPFQYANFEELEQAVDKIKGDKPRVRSNVRIDVDKNDIVAEDENVIIYRGDSQDKCILYGQGYTFCISRRAAGNMYSSYRGGKESTFYFIYFKNKPKEDNDHIMVLDHTRDGYEWTFANNNTQKVAGGWDEIVAKYKELTPFKDVLVNKKLDNVEREEIAVIQDFINDPSIKKFTKMDFNMRSRVLKMSIDLSDDIFKILSKDLINEFLSIGPNLTPLQVASLNDKQKDWYIRNREIQFDELVGNYWFRLNELDFELDKFKEYHTRDYNEAYNRIKNGISNLEHLRFLIKLPDNIPTHIDGSFICNSCNLNSLEGAPTSVSGGFSCDFNNITSLVGAPRKVGRSFSCCENKNLTSLEGAPSYVSGDFYCEENSNLTSLVGAPREVGGNFSCSGSNLTSLVGAPREVGGTFGCTLTDLTSLEGAPISVRGSFYCNENNLTSLVGAPISVGEDFNCQYNKLTSLKGAPISVGGDFNCNPQTGGSYFLDEEIEEAMEDSRERQAKSMLKENRKFTQKELICNMRYWF